MSDEIDLDRVAAEISHMRKRTTVRLGTVVAMLVAVIGGAMISSFRTGVEAGSAARQAKLTQQRLETELHQAQEAQTRAESEVVQLEREASQVRAENAKLKADLAMYTTSSPCAHMMRTCKEYKECRIRASPEECEQRVHESQSKGCWEGPFLPRDPDCGE